MVLKKLMLLACLMMVLAVPFTAQGITDTNVFVLSNDTDWYDTCAFVYVGQTSTVNLMVINPYNYDPSPGGGGYVANISGFECQLATAGNVYITGVQFPVPSINVGSLTNLVVGYSEPVPVFSEATVLATISYVVAADPGEQTDKASPMCSQPDATINLVPTERPSLEGLLAFVDADDTGDPLVGAYSYHTEYTSDFQIMLRVVGTEAASWGAVKALYK